MDEESKLNNNNWVDNNQDLAEEELIIRELLDDDSPFFLDLPNNYPSKNSNDPQTITNINSLISKVYSGPTILDIENALSSTQYHSQSQPRINSSILERGYSRIENNKYTLKLKSCGNNGMADDGYKWRKYGQKSIKNSPFPRSYYRCTNPRCSAKKQVERSNEEEDTIIITYEGLHLHFAFPYLEQAQAQKQEQAQSLSPPMKKPKKMEAQLSESRIPSQPQGLLEDVVPLMVRNPSKDMNHGNGFEKSYFVESGSRTQDSTLPFRNEFGSSNSSSSSSYYASPPTSPSSLSWSSNNSNSCFDVGVDTTCLLGR
ncbi:WRKY DNA-binding protein 49 [Euphorbia peplus]|nr:WRKY DNA-binding protein 49 [Euphorbia peplus]